MRYEMDINMVVVMPTPVLLRLFMVIILPLHLKYDWTFRIQISVVRRRTIENNRCIEIDLVFFHSFSFFHSFYFHKIKTRPNRTEAWLADLQEFIELWIVLPFCKFINWSNRFWNIECFTCFTIDDNLINNSIENA